VLPFVEAVASRAKTLIDYEGDVGVAPQHVGPLVGRNAHELLWPRIVEWITRLDLALDAAPRAAFNSMSR
jgi:polyhydroxyalkanoate synthase